MSEQKHPNWEEVLMPYVDGELEEQRAQSITQHLNGCEECAAAVADAQALSQRLRTWKLEEPSNQIAAGVLSELHGQKNGTPSQRRPWWGQRRVWTYGLAGALAASVLLVVVIPKTMQSPSTEAKLSMAVTTPSSSVGPMEFKKESAETGFAGGQQGQQGQQGGAAQGEHSDSGPMVIRNAYVTIITKEFDTTRGRIEAIVRQSQGYLDQLTVQGEVGSGRTLSASLRVPSDRTDSVLAEIRKLGRVREESQHSSDVTSEYVDLQARLSNARNTEQRLINLLKERTGKLADVVSVEKEISRVREEIERMEARRKDMNNKVQYATIGLQVTEEYRAALEPSVPSAGTQLRNAFIGGYHAALQSVLTLALFILGVGPALLMWVLVLLPIGLFVRRRIQRA